MAVLGVCGRAGSGGNGAAEALAAILLNNRTTGGMGLDSLLVSDLGLNRAKLAAVK